MSKKEKPAKPAEAKASELATKVDIPAMRIARLDVWVIGASPLIVHAWSKESRDDMLRKQMGMPTRRKRPKNPQQQIDDSFYMTADGLYGFKANAFKQAMVGACRSVDAKMTEAKQAFFVLGDIVPIYGSNPVAREDMVRLTGTTADIRFRPQFTEWACHLFIEYDSGMISAAQVINLLQRAGFAPGIGEWRPEKDGDFGRFRVANGDEGRAWEKRVPKVGSCKIEIEFEEESEAPTNGVARAS